jgi:hypothetical protein
MPWLESDPSGSFHIAFRFLGRRYRRTLKTSDRREAERLVARVEDNSHGIFKRTLSGTNRHNSLRAADFEGSAAVSKTVVS